jgi:hypothetical protein
MQYANAFSNLVSSVQKGISTIQKQQFLSTALTGKESLDSGDELQDQSSSEKPVTLVSTLKNAVASTAMRGSTGRSDQSTSMATLSEPESIRLQRFKQELSGSCINLHALKRLASDQRSVHFHGIPDKDYLRALVWKVQ